MSATARYPPQLALPLIAMLSLALWAQVIGVQTPCTPINAMAITEVISRSRVIRLGPAASSFARDPFPCHVVTAAQPDEPAERFAVPYGRTDRQPSCAN